MCTARTNRPMNIGSSCLFITASAHIPVVLLVCRYSSYLLSNAQTLAQHLHVCLPSNVLLRSHCSPLPNEQYSFCRMMANRSQNKKKQKEISWPTLVMGYQFSFLHFYPFHLCLPNVVLPYGMVTLLFSILFSQPFAAIAV